MPTTTLEIPKKDNKPSSKNTWELRAWDDKKKKPPIMKVRIKNRRTAPTIKGVEIFQWYKDVLYIDVRTKEYRTEFFGQGAEDNIINIFLSNGNSTEVSEVEIIFEKSGKRFSKGWLIEAENRKTSAVFFLIANKIRTPKLIYQR